MEMEPASAFNSTTPPPPMMITHLHHHQSDHHHLHNNFPNYPTNNYPNPTISSLPTTIITTPPPTPLISPTSNPWMNPRIWSRLPQRILDRILTFLPPPSFFRARSVCKRWYSLLFSPSFLHLTLHISPTHHYFLFFFNHYKPIKSHIYPPTKPTKPPPSAYLLDPSTLTWHRLTLPSIPPTFTPSASSGGLICYISDTPGPKSILLHNPLFHNTTPTHLPPSPRPRLSPTLGLTVTPSSLTLLLAGDDMVSPYAVKNLTTETLHLSDNNSSSYTPTGLYYTSLWTTTSSLPRLSSLESRQMVYSNHRFFTMNHSPFSVLTYHIPTNRWSKIQAPMRRFLRSPTLITLNNTEIIMVAAVEKSKLNVPRSLRMWKLQQNDQWDDHQEHIDGMGSSTWIEVERMPRRMYDEFMEIENGNGFDCVGNGEFVVINVRGGVNKTGVVFDALRKRWVWLPPCPFVCDDNDDNGGGGGELHGFAFEPRLVTPITGLVDQLGTTMVTPPEFGNHHHQQQQQGFSGCN